MDSVMEVVRYQRNIHRVSMEPPFSVRANWGRQISTIFGGSLHKYIESYKATVTYITLNGFHGPQDLIMGVFPDILNGTPSSGSSQSEFWNEFTKQMQEAIRLAQNDSNITLGFDWFSLTSPSDDVTTAKGALLVVGKLLTEVVTNNSATASGQFELDIKNAVSVNPFGLLDPKPVFNWAVTISLDPDTDSITLMISVTYDHMNSNNTLEVIAGIVIGVITAGVLGPVIGGTIGTAGGVVSGIAIGNSLSQAYDAANNNKLLDILAKDFNLQTWIASAGPIMFKASHPTSREYTLSMTLQLDSTTFNKIENFIQNQAALITVGVELSVFFAPK